MQSERGRGFLLEAPDRYPEYEYQYAKASVEKICDCAMKNCKLHGIENLNFAILAKESVFICVSVYQNESEFALYDRKSNMLIQECTIFDFKKYVTQSRLDVLAARIENECAAVSKGAVLDRKALDKAWKEKHESGLQQFENNVQWHKKHAR